MKKSFIVGITGHRDLPYPESCRKTLQVLFEKMVYSLRLQSSPMEMKLLSPLAEGADRLAAQEWLMHRHFLLECPLPVAPGDYLDDFESSQSKTEFQNLLMQCVNAPVMPRQPSRIAAYEAVGRYVVDHADLVIAIWDGKDSPKPAGTAAMVAYTRSLKKPLCWINSEKPERIIGERLDEIFRR